MVAIEPGVQPLGGVAQVDRPRTWLLVGRSSQGVGLASDILNAAAMRAGWTVECGERHGADRGMVSVVCRMSPSLMLSAAPPVGPARSEPVNLLGALDSALGWGCLSLLAAGGSAVFCRRVDQARFLPEQSRRDVQIDWHEDTPLSRLLVAGRSLGLLGRLSRQLPIPLAFWHEALAEHLPGSRLVTARHLFTAGRHWTLRRHVALERRFSV